MIPSRLFRLSLVFPEFGRLSTLTERATGQVPDHAITSIGVRRGRKTAPVDFVEQMVESLEIDNQSAVEAVRGKFAGINTALGKGQARKGIRVFRVKP